MTAINVHGAESRTGGRIGAFGAGLALGVGLSAAELVRRAWRDRRAHTARPAPPTSHADSPAALPPRDWRAAIKTTVKEFNDDRIPAVAASVTFFFLLALFPALSAFVSLYGLIADAGDAQQQVAGLAGLMPAGAIKVLSDNLDRLANASSGGLSLAFVVSLVVSVWSANSGVKALIAGLNIAYEAKEHRGFIRLNLVSLAFTVGAIGLAVVMLGVVVAAPAALKALRLDPYAGPALLRWPMLLVFVAGLLAVLYRFAPARPQPRWRWITPGGGLAAVAWIGMSALFSGYVENFAHYDKTYGSLGAIVGFLTWVWLSLMVVMFGAELNAALEARADAGPDAGRIAAAKDRPPTWPDTPPSRTAG